MHIRSIYIADSYANRLAAALDDARRSYMEAEAHLRSLEHEIADARRVPAHQIPKDYVAMYSRIRLHLSNPSQGMQLQLVLPEEADPARGLVSILAPIAAILGYRVGEEVDVEVAGKRRRIKILSVVHDPFLRRTPSGGLPKHSTSGLLHKEGFSHDQLTALTHSNPGRSWFQSAPWRQANHGVPADERSGAHAGAAGGVGGVPAQG